jgi:predicted metal-dependent enzyme (double-stranded beta helix superfamily)
MPKLPAKFDVDVFVEDCLVAWNKSGVEGVGEILKRSLADPAPIRETFGQPAEAGLTVLYPGPELVVENMVWAPRMTYPAHDHRTPVLTGVYSGSEVNEFFRKTGPHLVPDRTVVIGTGETILLHRDAIHKIVNPDRRCYAGAFHIYIGDYLHSQRSIWHPDEAAEAPGSLAITEGIFAEANRGLAG